MVQPHTNHHCSHLQLHHKHRSYCHCVHSFQYSYPSAWVQLVISIFLCILWIPLGLYVFYLPYMILLKNEGSRIWFYGLSAITCIWFFIWAIANFADANGFVRVSDYFNAGYKVAGGFAVIESILCLVVALLAAFNAFLFSRKWCDIRDYCIFIVICDISIRIFKIFWYLIH